ncbi:MAG TPA: hypothetical protein VM238_21110 [Phycisphaerae bacterium]|nr:hypothetical protein [Phycisphaerae bacterium]
MSADWQTPDAAVILGGHLSRGGKRKDELLLAGQVKANWTTPQSHDAQGTPDAKRHGRYGTKHGGRNLPDQVAVDWRSPAAQEPGVNPERLAGGKGHRAYDKETGRLAQYGLTQQAQAEWPTPAALTTAGEQNRVVGWKPGEKPKDKDGKPIQTALSTVVKLVEWPTPGANDDKNLGAATPGKSPQLRHLPGLLAQANPSTSGKPRGCLNSRWVASLMGYPPDWCDVPTETLSRLTATASSRKSRRK